MINIDDLMKLIVSLLAVKVYFFGHLLVIDRTFWPMAEIFPAMI